MLRFDNLGLGDSEGDWGDGSFSVKVADTVQAARFMNESGRTVRLLVGHSFGGAAVIAAAHQLDSVRASTTWCGSARWPWASDHRTSGPGTSAELKRPVPFR